MGAMMAEPWGEVPKKYLPPAQPSALDVFGKIKSDYKPWWGQPDSQGNRLSISREPWSGSDNLRSVASAKPGPTYFAPHDSERPAMRALASHIDETGGRILSFDNSGNRSITSGRLAGSDPNRIFKPGIAAGDELGTKLLAGTGMVVTAHNNAPTGSFVGDVSSQPNKFIVDPANKHDIVWAAGGVPHAKSADAQYLTQCLSSKGVNSLYEYVPPTGALNGSLSQYVARTAPERLYANVEARHYPDKRSATRSDADTTMRQRAMLAAVLACAPENRGK